MSPRGAETRVFADKLAPARAWHEQLARFVAGEGERVELATEPAPWVALACAALALFGVGLWVAGWFLRPLHGYHKISASEGWALVAAGQGALLLALFASVALLLAAVVAAVALAAWVWRRWREPMLVAAAVAGAAMTKNAASVASARRRDDIEPLPWLTPHKVALPS